MHIFSRTNPLGRITHTKTANDERVKRNANSGRMPKTDEKIEYPIMLVNQFS